MRFSCNSFIFQQYDQERKQHITLKMFSNKAHSSIVATAPQFSYIAHVLGVYVAVVFFFCLLPFFLSLLFHIAVFTLCGALHNMFFSSRWFDSEFRRVLKFDGWKRRGSRISDSNKVMQEKRALTCVYVCV